jgi:hypothetical protein
VRLSAGGRRARAPELAGAGDRLAADVGVELGVDVPDAGPDRVRRDEQPRGDLWTCVCRWRLAARLRCWACPCPGRPGWMWWWCRS